MEILNELEKVKILVFLGPPGAGKGTLAKRLQNEFGWRHISTGLLCRQFAKEDSEIGIKVKKLINDGNLISDDLITDMLKDSLERDKNSFKPTIIDGYPRTLNQLEIFYKYLEDKKLLDSTSFIIFDADKLVLKNRLAGRIVCSNLFCENIYNNDIFKQNLTEEINCLICSSKLVKRADDTEDLIEKRLSDYDKTRTIFFSQCKEKNLNLLFVDCMKEKEKVYDNFLNDLKNKSSVFAYENN